jgi:methionyl-tRNA formyltransferase
MKRTMRIAIINKNPLFDFVEDELKKKYECLIIKKPDNLSDEALDAFKPEFCIFLHWSFKIQENIYNRHKTILFHMTDLPYGRGGSPLQNLIARGATETKLSAITVVEKLDEGDVYLKRKLDLRGSASEIFKRAGQLMIEMINEIIENKTEPVPQVGKPVYFKRRKPEESDISTLDSIQDIYDHIRMLDAPGYPNAFFKNNDIKFEFYNAELDEENKTVTANVRISKK